MYTMDPSGPSWSDCEAVEGRISDVLLEVLNGHVLRIFYQLLLGDGYAITESDLLLPSFALFALFALQGSASIFWLSRMCLGWEDKLPT